MASNQAIFDPPLSPQFKITPELLSRHGILPEEYERIQAILGGREPTATELGIFSAMWSEHCSYKNSRRQLKKFPTAGARVLVRAGEENAGIIDIGDNLAVAFKIESHNHPSAVEPFQGAATGVGGILRDIFTMGARPVALLNSLRFGPLNSKEAGDEAAAATNKRLLRGVVSGIAHYGNCVGVPTVGGEVAFDKSYNGNPLVNVFCLGVLRHSQIRKASARGVGNPVFYVGSKTGRDGLAAAAFASRDLTEESKQDRPAVQVGDPFTEKLLVEACLELFMHPEAVIGVQDMGAAGLTCSTCETASRGNVGIEIELAKVPQRESGMTPYEIMLSESQERMLIIAKKGCEETILSIFRKWGLDVAQIGEVTDTGRVIVRHHGSVVADIPARPLADEAPLYIRESKEPEDWETRREFNFEEEISLSEISSLKESLPRILSHPSLTSKRWIYEQYDHTVRASTILGPGQADSAVVRVRGESIPGQEDGPFKYLALTVDCNGRYCALDPFEGAKAAVAEAASNLVMTGALPLAITDNLNFGNPYQPAVFWQLERAVDGISEACRAFDLPVTGGNVSLYNQSPQGVVDPTPTIGMVGQIQDPSQITPLGFKQVGDLILLVGGIGHEMGGSAYLKYLFDLKKGLSPRVDLARHKKFLEAVLALIQKGIVQSAHDISEGGLAVALAESAFANSLGANVKIESDQRPDIILYNETQSRAILTIQAAHQEIVLEYLKEKGIEVSIIGKVISEPELSIQMKTHTLMWQLNQLRDLYENSLERQLV